jgi:hypothetical protein
MSKFSVSMDLYINEDMKNTMFVVLRDFNKENGISDETDNFDDILTGYFSRKVSNEDETGFINNYNITHQKDHILDNIKFNSVFFEDENYKDTIEKFFILLCSYLDIGSEINVKINNKKYKDYKVNRDKYSICTHTDRYQAYIFKSSNQIDYISEYVECVYYDIYNNKELSHHLIPRNFAGDYNKLLEERGIYVQLPIAQTFMNLMEKGFNPISEMSSYYYFKKFNSNKVISIYIATNDKYGDIKELERIFADVVKDTSFEVFTIIGRNGASFVCLNCKREYFKDVDLDIINFRIKNLN